jgi:hypothetical protein
MFNVHLLISDALANEVESHINMLTTIMENMILTEGNSQLAIHFEKKG